MIILAGVVGLVLGAAVGGLVMLRVCLDMEAARASIHEVARKSVPW